MISYSMTDIVLRVWLMSIGLIQLVMYDVVLYDRTDIVWRVLYSIILIRWIWIPNVVETIVRLLTFNILSSLNFPYYYFCTFLPFWYFLFGKENRCKALKLFLSTEILSYLFGIVSHYFRRDSINSIWALIKKLLGWAHKKHLLEISKDNFWRCP